MHEDLTTLLATATLSAGLQSQTPSRRRRRRWTNRPAATTKPSNAIQRRTGRFQANPSPTVGAGGMQSGNPGSVRKQDESAGGNSGAVERNPDGSTGGSKANPSPR